MATYNIQMEYFNGSSYDTLQPQTILNNIIDWASNLYSQTEVNNLLSQKANSSTVSSLQKIVNNMKISFGSYTGTAETISAGEGDTAWVTIQCGFRPTFVYIDDAIKGTGTRASSSSTNGYDGIYNGESYKVGTGSHYIQPLSMTSNGFRVRNSKIEDSSSRSQYVYLNQNNVDYFYCAFS